MREGWWSTEAGGIHFYMAYSEPGVHPRRLDLIERLCRVAEEEGVELMHHFLAEDAGGEGRGGRGRMAQRARRVVYSELEVEHLVMGLNWYGEGRGTTAAIAQDARLVFKRAGVRTGGS